MTILGQSPISLWPSRFVFEALYLSCFNVGEQYMISNYIAFLWLFWPSLTFWPILALRSKQNPYLVLDLAFKTFISLFQLRYLMTKKSRARGRIKKCDVLWFTVYFFEDFNFKTDIFYSIFLIFIIIYFFRWKLCGCPICFAS